MIDNKFVYIADSNHDNLIKLYDKIGINVIHGGKLGANYVNNSLEGKCQCRKCNHIWENKNLCEIRTCPKCSDNHINEIYDYKDFNFVYASINNIYDKWKENGMEIIKSYIDNGGHFNGLVYCKEWKKPLRLNLLDLIDKYSIENPSYTNPFKTNKNKNNLLKDTINQLKNKSKDELIIGELLNGYCNYSLNENDNEKNDVILEHKNKIGLYDDFYIKNKKIVIECQGIQHLTTISHSISDDVEKTFFWQLIRDISKKILYGNNLFIYINDSVQDKLKDNFKEKLVNNICHFIDSFYEKRNKDAKKMIDNAIQYHYFPSQININYDSYIKAMKKKINDLYLNSYLNPYEMIYDIKKR